MAATRDHGEYTGAEDGGARYRALLEANPDALLAVDLEGRITETNAALQKLTGRSGTELLGVDTLTLFEDPARAREGLVRVLSEGKITDFPLRIVGPGGSVTPIYFNGAILRGPNGEPTGALGVARDLTKLAQAEKELEEVYGRMRSHLENSPAGVVEWDNELRILSWSAGAERLFGYSAEEAIGKTIGRDLKIVHEDDAEEVGAIIESLLNGSEQRVAFENRNCRKDGSVIYCEWINSVLREERGQVTTVMSIAMDVTRRKHLEAGLRHLADHDPLTGLYNRRAFRTQLEASLARLGRYGADEHRTLAVLYFDLDHFKPINDMYGHATGDEMLRQVAGRLTACLRGGDIPARLGGDEFAVILQPVSNDDAGDQKGARAAAERVIRTMQEPFQVDGTEASLRLGVSLGTAVGSGEDSADDILRRADEHMYRSKLASRSARAKAGNSSP